MDYRGGAEVLCIQSLIFFFGKERKKGKKEGEKNWEKKRKEKKKKKMSEQQIPKIQISSGK